MNETQNYHLNESLLLTYLSSQSSFFSPISNFVERVNILIYILVPISSNIINHRGAFLCSFASCLLSLNFDVNVYVFYR